MLERSVAPFRYVPESSMLSNAFTSLVPEAPPPLSKSGQTPNIPYMNSETDKQPINIGGGGFGSGSLDLMQLMPLAPLN